MNICEICSSVSIHIRHLGDLDLIRFAFWLRFSLGKKRQLLLGDRRTIIAGSDEFFETERIEIERKILEEITLVRVITITEHYFITEVLAIVD